MRFTVKTGLCLLVVDKSGPTKKAGWLARHFRPNPPITISQQPNLSPSDVHFTATKVEFAGYRLVHDWYTIGTTTQSMLLGTS